MLCAPPKDPFVLLWIEETEAAAGKGFGEYCDEIYKADVGKESLQQLIPRHDDMLKKYLPYLTPYLCFRVAYEKATHMPQILLPFDMGDLPLHWANVNSWNAEESLRALLGEQTVLQNPPIIKLASTMKTAVIRALDNGQYVNNNSVVQALGYNKKEITSESKVDENIKKSVQAHWDQCAGSPIWLQ